MKTAEEWLAVLMQRPMDFDATKRDSQNIEAIKAIQSDALTEAMNIIRVGLSNAKCEDSCPCRLSAVGHANAIESYRDAQGKAAK